MFTCIYVVQPVLLASTVSQLITVIIYISATILCGYCIPSGKAIAGTTDTPTELTALPAPREEDIRFILEEIKDYLSPEISGQSDYYSLVFFVQN